MTMTPRELAERERLRRALRAVLLFHGGGPWDEPRRREWIEITQHEEATTKILCDVAREALGDEATP